MRKKTIEYDGAQFTISPLTFDQSEEVITRPRPAGTASFTAMIVPHVGDEIQS
jgi:hypothetical protein